MTDAADNVLEGFDAQKVEADRDAAFREAAEHEVTLAKVDRRAREARARGEALDKMLTAYRGYAAIVTPMTASARFNANLEIAVPSNRADAITGRASVLAVIVAGEDGQEWTIGTVADQLGVGWDHHKAIATSLQRLTKGFNGMPPQIKRLRKGVYTKLPPGPVTAAPGEGQEMSTNGSQDGPGSAESLGAYGLLGLGPAAEAGSSQ